MTSVAKSFYELSPLDSSDEPYSFEQLKGKVILIVNVASKCGFTPQYKDLEELNKKYASKGLQIIAFPSNSFKQERENQENIVQFCYLNFGVDFPIMKKISVNGPDTDPVYKYLKQKKSGILGIKSIKWNFEKFLIDKKGRIVERYSSLTNPLQLELVIEKLLLE